MITDVMVDIETLGKCAGCVVFSIAAVGIDRENLMICPGPFDSGPIGIQNSLSRGFTTDSETIKWWQSQEHRDVFEAAMVSTFRIQSALEHFAEWYPVDAMLWGNGADFDNAILSYAYNRFGMSTPWKYQNQRCYRTFKNEIPVPKPEFTGTKHVALDDARFQAEHLIRILEVLRGKSI